MTIQPHDWYPLASYVAGSVLNSLLVGIAVAFLAWTVTRLARRQGSGTRFAVWFIALIAVVIISWFGRLTTGFSHGISAGSASALTLPESFAFYLVVAWIIGAAFGLIRVATSLHQLQRLRSDCTAVDLNQLDQSLRASLADACTHRQVTLCTSDAVRVPAAIGYFRPMIVLPTWALRELPPADLNAILLHELAHLRRWDDWTNLTQKIVKAVFFYHPAVWFIESHLSLEREMACDDAVLAANFSPHAYAESLVSLAEKSLLRRGIQLAQAAVSHVQQLKMRLTEILRRDKYRPGSTHIGKPAIALMSLATIIAVCGFSRLPRLIAFSSASSQMVASPVARVEPVFKPASTSAAFGNAERTLVREASIRDKVSIDSTSVPKVGPTRLHISHRVPAQSHVVLAVRRGELSIATDETQRSMMVLSDLPMELPLAPAPVLVVFQGEQFAPYGPIVWRVRVLHFTSSQQRVITGGFPKQV